MVEILAKDSKEADEGVTQAVCRVLQQEVQCLEKGCVSCTRSVILVEAGVVVDHTLMWQSIVGTPTCGGALTVGRALFEL